MLSKRRRRWRWSQNSHSMNFWQRHTAARSRRFRPTLEALEDRRLLSDFLVTSTRDDGSTNTLRWAINQANTDQGPTTEIDIDNTTLPTNTIRVSSPLPAITHPVSILVVPETDRHPPFMSIILDGSNAGGLANGLVIETDSCHVQGLTIQNFSGSGILISGTQASAGIIECVIQNNGSNGVTMQAGANHNELDLDVLSGNFAAGVLITDSGTNHNDVTNSQIGTTADGSAAQGNSSGVVIENGASSNNISADTISGNSFDGVDVLGPVRSTTTSVLTGSAPTRTAARRLAIAPLRHERRLPLLAGPRPAIAPSGYALPSWLYPWRHWPGDRLPGSARAECAG